MISVNCDLGEWESSDETRWMMQHIDLANVACGTHAGSAEKIVKCRTLADSYNVKMGMHPGSPGSEGRGDLSNLSVCNFYDLLEAQYVIFEKYAGKPTHIKLHGSLYHLSETNLSIREAYLEFCKSVELPIVALAGQHVSSLANESNVVVIEEAFLDRQYLANGQLVSREKSGAVITDFNVALSKYEQLIRDEGIDSIDGERLKCKVDTLCVHSDSLICKKVLSSIGVN